MHARRTSTESCFTSSRIQNHYLSSHSEVVSSLSSVDVFDLFSPRPKWVMGATIRESCHILPFNLCLSAAQCQITRYPYHITADEVSSSEAIIDPPVSVMGCLVLTGSCIHMMSYANAMSRCALPWLMSGRGHFQMKQYDSRSRHTITASLTDSSEPEHVGHTDVFTAFCRP